MDETRSNEPLGGTTLAWWLLWIHAWVGATVASAIFGAVFGYFDAKYPTDHDPLGTGAGMVFGVLIGGILCGVVYLNVAAISWLVGMQRGPRLLTVGAAVLAGTIIGLFEYMWVRTIPTLVLGTFIPVELYLRCAAIADIFKRQSERRKVGVRMQLSIASLMLRVAAIAVLIVFWKSVYSNWGHFY